PEPEPPAGHNATCSSTCTGDFHQSGLRRTNAAKARSSKQDQYRRERFRVAVSTVWRNVSARQSGESAETGEQNEQRPTLAIGRRPLCYSRNARDTQSTLRQTGQKSARR